MATAKCEDDDLLACPICFEQFTSPKYLPCSHTFCHHCLRSYIIAQLGGEGKQARPFPCPICRKSVMITEKVSSEQIADMLPGNHFITSLIDRSQVSQGKKSCDPCSSRNEKRIAISWCTSCLEALCENCTTYHKQLKITKNHVTVPIDDSYKTMEIDVEEPCMKHAGNVLQVYCVDHREMCCVICLATQHRKCEHISTFEEMVTDPKSGKTVENFKKCLTDIEKKTDELRTMAENNESRLAERQLEISRSVSNFIETAKGRLDSLHADFNTKFQALHKKQNIKISQKKTQIGTFQQTLKKGGKLMDAVCEQGSPRQIFITKEKMKTQLKDQVESMKQGLEQVECCDYTLEIDDVLKAVASLSSVAQVSMKTRNLSGNLTSLFDAVDNLCIEESESVVKTKPVDVQNLKISKQHTITADGGFMGGTYLPDGRVILCNFNRNKLQAYDNDKLLFEHSSLDSGAKPVDACCILPNEILVSFFQNPCLTKYEVAQNAFKVKDEITCQEEPSGLAVAKDGIVVAFKGKIEVWDLSGKIKKTLSVGRYGWPTYVTTSSSSNIYHKYGNHVVCKSSNGKEVTKFFSPYLNDPHGIAVDAHGNVFVCGYSSKNVCVFSPDGTTSQKLIESVTKPWGIFFDFTKTKMFLATSTGGEVYTCKF